MLFSHEYVLGLVAQERRRDPLREAEQVHLARLAQHRQPNHWHIHRMFAGWIGIRMIQWGYWLQSYGSSD